MSLADPVELVKTLISHDAEQEWFEFKRGAFEPEEFGEYVSALANSAMLEDKRHAFLLYGIDDKSHAVVGTDVRLKTLKKGGENFEHWLQKMLSPKVNIYFESCVIESKHVEIACIEPAYDRPVRFQNNAYIRIGENKKRLQEYPEKERALWALTNRQSFERGISGTDYEESMIFSQFHTAKFSEYFYPHCTSNSALLESLLGDGLIMNDLQGGVDVTNLFALLSAKDISKHRTIENKAPRVIVYKSRGKSDALQDNTGQTGYAITFPILLRYIMDHVSGEERFIHGVRRKETYYPEIAVREFLANALIHQDLIAQGAPPTVEIYSDKIKIFNLGRPFVEPERIIDAPPRARNERLASFMRRAGHCELRGSGVPRALVAIESAGQAPPLFQVAGDSYVVTMFKATEFSAMSRDDRLRACYQHAVLCHLNNSPMNNQSLRRRLRLKDTQASQASNLIKDAQENGLIKPLDPNQGYRIAKYLPHWA
jgi:predicted HTH transcriptional regulator